MFSKRQIFVGNIKIGGDAGVSVQTMTNSNTEDVNATIAQIDRATSLGGDLVRVSCPTPESTIALKEIVRMSPLPIIADIHFNHKRALEALEAGAHCIRINPGTISEYGISEIVRAAKDFGAAIRLGINSGSVERDILDQFKEPSVDAIVESAVRASKKLEDLGFYNFKVSVKSSDVKNTIEAYRKLSRLIDYPLHLGVTEAGTLFSGTIKSSIGIGTLLAEGIGDTIRVSLSSDIADEVKVGRQILNSLGLLGKNRVNIVSCPTCARSGIQVVEIAKALEDYCENINKPLKISVLGCIVNGIGEAKGSDIGVFGAGHGMAKIYLKGKEIETISSEEILEKVKKLIDDF